MNNLYETMEATLCEMQGLRDELAEAREQLRLTQAEIEEQARLLGMGGEREARLITERDEARGVVLKYREAASELIRLLEIEEESDSGTSFKPNRINSCRIMDTMQMNQCLKTLKGLSQ